MIARLAMVVAVAAWWALPASAQQDSLRDEKNRWSVRIPPGWSPAPEGFVERIQQEFARRAPDASFRYVGGLVPQGGSGGAFVLLQFTAGDLSRTDAAQMAEQMNATVLGREVGRATRGFQDLIAGISPGQAVFDAATGRYAVEMSATTVDGSSTRTLVLGIAARHGLAQVNCTAPEAQFESLRPVFESLGASITLDAGWEWDPTGGGSGGGSVVMPRWLRSALAGAAAGGIAGGVLVVIRKLRAGKSGAHPET